MPSERTPVAILPYSKATACTPELYRFDGLDRNIAYAFPEGVAGPTLTEGGADDLTYRIVELPESGTSTLFIHFYNGSGTSITARLFSEDGKAVGKSKELRAVAGKLIVPEGSYPAGRLYLRIEYLLTAELRQRYDDERGLPFVSVATYLGEEPGSAGSLPLRIYDRCQVRSPEEQKAIEVPYDCPGTATQRLVLSSCDMEYEMKEWVAMIGLPVVEEYYGPLGSVVALSVERGLDLNTTGGAIDTTESEINGGHGTVSPDYLINFYNQAEPAVPGKPRKTNRPPGEPGNSRDRKAPDFDQNLDPFVVALIDSGVDHAEINAHHWETTRYRQRAETEFIRPWKLGFDFMDKDSAPDDAAAHGTSVAATVLRQYRSRRPLNLIHLKTFGAGGISTYFGALVSLYEAAAVGANVINMSWGVYGEQPPPGLECAIKTAIKCGAKLVTSAGNDSKNLDDEPQWPAAFAGQDPYRKHLLSVASFGWDKEEKSADPNQIALSSYSNYSPERVSLAAFMTAGVPQVGTGRTIYPLGTSISTPIVTGMLANWLADNPHGSVADFCRHYCKQACLLEHKTVDARYIPLEHSDVLPL